MSTDDDTMMLDEACLLDVPDELLKLIVAASTGQGVAAMSCACKRLRAVAKQLQASPIMCSAMSTDNDLHVAIREATHRAMAGSWGAADFALIFVANYGLPKKYTDPGDASHAVDMLREVLGKDIPIVGCACSGIMGVGADSRPAEVDPSMAGSSSSSRRAKVGPATRGVTVLLGKVPAGCAVRAFAAAQGPAAADAAWPEFEEALSLTSSQRTQLAAELAAAAAAATATAAPAAAGSSAAELVPQMCLLLYRNAYFVEGGELDWLKAHHPGMHVVGGASSGAGDLLFSAAGTTPGPFTGAEDEVLLLEFWQFKRAAPAAELAEPQAVQVLVHREAEGPVGLLPGGTEADPLAGITQHSVWQQRPGSKLCIQLLVNSGEGSKAAISRGLALARKELWPLGAAAAAPAAAGSGFMAGCYAAAAANARAAGARSGLMGQAVFSCTARGRELYNRDDDDDVEGDETEGHQAGLHADGEAALVDAAMQQGCPFVGVYCDGELGPPVQHGCLGWAEEGVSSISTGFTSMFAVFGFRAG
ncbi:hypothetical protein OEZ85_007972 [Tetradesmus obliquus]|uniref:FIST domain-containing protein n=1 Tax=Tetradesmus obliquus TaxID=3088 RepID=A0ABY8THT2_TETOB|nr:hypothetical protein OEZ85_007972 [Tetradesmus obliquus]